MSNPFIEESIGWMISSTEAGGIPLLILISSLSLNYFLFKKMMESIKIQKKFTDLLKSLQPLLSKIINGQSLSTTDMEDLRIIRNLIKYGILC